MDSYRSKKFERKSRSKCVKNILFLITVITICSKSWQALFVNILLQPLWTTCPFASHEHSCILIDIAISKTLYFVKLPVTKTSWLICTWGFFWRQNINFTNDCAWVNYGFESNAGVADVQYEQLPCHAS